MEVASLLKNIRFFIERKISEKDVLELVPACNLESFKKTENVIRYGDHGNKFFIILKGILSVQIPNPKIKNWRLLRLQYSQDAAWKARIDQEYDRLRVELGEDLEEESEIAEAEEAEEWSPRGSQLGDALDLKFNSNKMISKNNSMLNSIRVSQDSSPKSADSQISARSRQLDKRVSIEVPKPRESQRSSKPLKKP